MKHNMFSLFPLSLLPCPLKLICDLSCVDCSQTANSTVDDKSWPHQDYGNLH